MNFFLFYVEMVTKITGSAQNYRVGRVSGNTPIFLGLSICLFAVQLVEIFTFQYILDDMVLITKYLTRNIAISVNRS